MGAELWTCPGCGRSFANRNQWHSCDTATLEERTSTWPPLARDLLSDIQNVLAAAAASPERAGAPPLRVHPQRSRVAFITRMTFAGLAPGRSWADLSLILPTPVENARIDRIDVYGPTSFGHRVRLRDRDEIDDDVRAWLAAALRRGDQTTLDPDARPGPLQGHALHVAQVPLRATVRATGTAEAWLVLPGWVHPLMLAASGTTVRVAGETRPCRLHASGGRTAAHLDGPLLRELGLGEGEKVDAVLRAVGPPPS